MKIAAISLKIVSIAVNIVLCAVIGLALVLSDLNGHVKAPMAGAFAAGVVNLILFIFSGRFMQGTIGAYSVCIAVIMNVTALAPVIFGLHKFGFADDIRINFMIWTWLIFPVITIPALVLNRIGSNNLNSGYSSVLSA